MQHPADAAAEINKQTAAINHHDRGTTAEEFRERTRRAFRAVSSFCYEVYCSRYINGHMVDHSKANPDHRLWQADLAPKEMAASDMRNRHHVQPLLTWSTNAAHPVSLDQEPLQVVECYELSGERSWADVTSLEVKEQL
ncbi:hypothetical protein LAZ67_3006071 [Cordylochernes scorpioides]|uniref:Uncharacterized protein n=1 Tax=Cordylochernes scorpioides TaxID=51811 RepID=A0ABY6KDZ8_9ARAC|nr:hypothetical protein LAZ67_3006071 [Cordylochernes scorpioides]